MPEVLTLHLWLNVERVIVAVDSAEDGDLYLAAQQALGKNLATLWADGDRHMEALVREIDQTQRAATHEGVFVISANQTAPCRMVMSRGPEFVEGERGWLVSITDLRPQQNLLRELQESQHRYQNVITHLDGVAYRALNDEKWSMEYTSDGAINILGVSADDLKKGKVHPADIVHPDDLEKTRERLAIGLAKKQSVHHEFRIITPNGQLKWIVERCRGVFDQNDHLVAIEGLLFDVTETKKLKQQLTERNETLRIFTNNMPVAVAMFDTQMRYLLHSKQWVKNFGLGEQQLIGKCHYDVFPHLPPQWKKAHQRGLAGETIRKSEDCFAHPDGRLMWVRWEIHPWHIAPDEIGGIILFSENVTEQKLAQLDLERVQHAVDLASDGIFMLNPETLKFFYVNEGAVRQTGYSKQELLAMRPTDLTPELSEADVQEIFRPLMNGDEEAISFRVVHTRKDGKKVPVEINLQFNKALPGNASSLVAVARDRSRNEEAERLLHQNEERYRTIVSAMSDVIFVFDQQARYVDVHTNDDGVLVMKREDFLGKHISVVMNDDLVAKYTRHARDLRETGQPQRFEYTLDTSEGEKSHFLCTLNRHANGEWVIASIINITERKRMELELKAREVILSAAATVANQLLTASNWEAQVDTLLNVLGVAAGASRVYIFKFYLNTHGEECVNHIFEWCDEGITPEINNPRLRNQRVADLGFSRWMKQFRSGSPVHGPVHTFPEQEHEVLKAQGIRSLAIFPILVREQLWGFIGFDQCKSRHVWSGTELAALSVTATTIGSAIERQLAEKEVLELNEALEKRVAERTEKLAKANEELEAFSYSVSHDLRAPLRAVVGFSNILLDDYGARLDEEGRRILKVIEGNTLRMGSLIDDLISFARLGKKDLLLKPTDMEKLVHSVAHDLSIHDAQHIAFKVLPLGKVQCDERLIRQVFYNLLANALKYSSLRPNPTIEVGYAFEDGRHIYSVRDNGVGFDMAYYDKLFGVFQRLHSNPEFEGTGIGLALVKRIIEKHHGTIWAEGVVDGGAVFYFSLPGG